MELLNNFIQTNTGIVLSALTPFVRKDEIEYILGSTFDTKFLIVLKKHVSHIAPTVMSICERHLRMINIKKHLFNSYSCIYSSRYLDGRWIFIFKFKGDIQCIDNVKKLSLTQIKTMSEFCLFWIENDIYVANMSEYQWFLLDGELKYFDLEGLTDSRPEILTPTKTLVYDIVSKRKSFSKHQIILDSFSTVEEAQKEFISKIIEQMWTTLTTNISKMFTKHEELVKQKQCSSICNIPFISNSDTHKFICSLQFPIKDKFKQLYYSLQNF